MPSTKDGVKQENMTPKPAPKNNNKQNVKSSTSSQENVTPKPAPKNNKPNVKPSTSSQENVTPKPCNKRANSSGDQTKRITRSQSHNPPARESACKCKKRELEHPYIQKIDAKLDKLHTLINGIFELADNDLIIADRDTGINDYDMQFKFAEKLDNISADLKKLIKDCSDQASLIREKITSFKTKSILCRIPTLCKK